MKKAYSARELAELFGVTERAMQLRAKREGWDSRPRKGKGGGNEFFIATMPQKTRDQIADRLADQFKVAKPTPIAKVDNLPAEQSVPLKEWQRDIRDARLVILREIEAMGLSIGIMKAERKFAELAKSGELSEELLQYVETANAKRGKGRAVSAASLRNWRRILKNDGADALAPKASQGRPIPKWLPEMLNEYRQPTKPSIASCHEKLEKRGVKLPSLSTVEREIRAIGVVEANRGRLGPRELKKMLAFKRRDFKSLVPADCFTSDGHCMDMEVAHPRHGRPFRPEMISVLDVATRVCVGWSVALAESSFGVADALRCSIERGSIPAIFYVDNGCGYKNAYMDNAATGIMDRLGITKMHSIAYNSQARGVIELFNKNCWIRAAKEVPTYVGHDMDQQARQAIFKRTRNDIKLKGESDVMMSWEDFMKWAEGHVSAYNNRPHSSLPKVRDPQTGRKRHMTPAECWDCHMASGVELTWAESTELEDCFRPYEVRTVRRCEIKLFKSIYFNTALTYFHEQEVQVGYDIHDSSKVYVRDLEGRFVCTAELDANKTDYIPKSMLEEAREKRAMGRIKRLETHRNEVLEELEGRRMNVIEAEPLTERQKAIQAETVQALEEAPRQKVIELPKRTTKQGRFEEALELMAAIENKEFVAPEDAQWLGGYQTTPEYKAQIKFYEDFKGKGFGIGGN
jgi:putative transposase